MKTAFCGQCQEHVQIDNGAFDYDGPGGVAIHIPQPETWECVECGSTELTETGNGLDSRADYWGE